MRTIDRLDLGFGGGVGVSGKGRLGFGETANAEGCARVHVRERTTGARAPEPMRASESVRADVPDAYNARRTYLVVD